MKQPLRVADQYRTNKLSKQPGGVTIVVEYYDGRVLEYDKVKNPTAYINALKSHDIKDAWVKATNEKINFKRK